MHRVGRRSNRGSLIAARKGRFAVAAIVVALAATVSSFALGNSGTVATNVTPASGVPSNGSVASVDTSITSTVTRSQGNAQLQTGVTLGRIEVADAWAAKIQISVFWTDPYDGGKVLNNPNSLISVGIYDPIHTGTCVSTASSTVAQFVTVTDGLSNTYCSRLDEAATGSANVSSVGKLLLSRSTPGGYLKPQTLDGGSLSACGSYAGTAPGESSLSWCEPAATAAGSLTPSGPGVLYVVGSILTPGTSAIGQQATLSTLHFFVNVIAE